MKKAIPTKWMTIDVAWGEQRKHLYTPDEKSLKYHHTERQARDYAGEEIQRGSTMVAVMEIKTVFTAKAVEYDELR